MIDLINKLINYLNVLKQETKLSIPAQTGNRTMKIYTSIEKMLSVDHWPPKRKDMQLIIDFDNFNCIKYFDYFNNSNYFYSCNYFNYFNYFNDFNYFNNFNYFNCYLLFFCIWLLRQVLPLWRSVINWQNPLIASPHVNNSISCLGWN